MHYLIHYRCAKCLDYGQTCNSDLLCNFQWKPPMMRIFYYDSNQIRQRYYVIYIKIKVTGNNSTYWSARRKPVMLIWFRANLRPCSRHFLCYYFLHSLSTYFHSPPGAQALSLESIYEQFPHQVETFFMTERAELVRQVSLDERLSCGCPKRREYVREQGSRRKKFYTLRTNWQWLQIFENASRENIPTMTETLLHHERLLFMKSSRVPQRANNYS